MYSAVVNSGEKGEQRLDAMHTVGMPGGSGWSLRNAWRAS